MNRTGAILAVAALAAATACGSGAAPGVDASPDADASSPSTPDARDGGGYGERPDGGCTPGVPRCQGDFGYRECQADGTWSEPHSCAGYSSNGTTSYCADLTQDTGEPWGTCIDPACWYWLKRGAPMGSLGVGICEPDGAMRACSAGGTLAPAACDGACVRVGTLDARALGYCAPACEDGARECVGGPFHRACVKGRWQAPVACDGACNPVAASARPDVRCGGACDPGTSRCRADLSAVEVCSAQGAWTLDKTCALGRCRAAGPQAQCEAECAAGQRACAFDGAGAERRCDDAGRWTAEAACAQGTSCRLSGDFALGCVACVPARAGGGNAYGAADSRCGAAGVETCGGEGAWGAGAPCPGACVAITRGASSLAACQAP
jgi:hypothetical protein